ncbi:hypothetical protein [Nocardioides pacificus]
MTNHPSPPTAVRMTPEGLLVAGAAGRFYAMTGAAVVAALAGVITGGLGLQRGELVGITSPWPAAIVTLLSLLLLGVVVGRLIRLPRGPQLLLTPTALVYRGGFARGDLAWDDISAVQLVPGGMPQLQVRTDDAEIDVPQLEMQLPLEVLAKRLAHYAQKPSARAELAGSVVPPRWR